MAEIRAGWSSSQEQDRMVYTSLSAEGDLELPGDQRTMRILSQIANTVDINLKFEFDCPSLHPVDQVVPILNL